MSDRRREYDGDVHYEVWRRGGNTDRINYDRVGDAYYEGISSESCASRELQRMRPQPIQEEYEEEQYPQEPSVEDECEGYGHPYFGFYYDHRSCYCGKRLDWPKQFCGL